MAKKLILRDDFFPVPDREYDLFREALPVYGSSNLKAGTWSAGQTLIGISIPASQMWHGEVSVSCNAGPSLQLQITPHGIRPSGSVQPLHRIFLPTTGGTFKLDTASYPEKTQFALVGAAENTDANVIAYLSVPSVKTACRHNYNAPFTVLIIGDSISDGTAGVTYGSELYSWTAIDTLAPEYEFYPIHKTQGSWNSTNVLEALRTGRLDVGKVDLIIYNAGMNDSSATTYNTTLTEILNWKNKRQAAAKMVVCGPSLRIDSQETVLAAIRTAAAAAVTAQASSAIAYVNLGNVWASGDHGTYTTDGTHPNTAGHALMSVPLAAQLSTWFS